MVALVLPTVLIPSKVKILYYLLRKNLVMSFLAGTRTADLVVIPLQKFLPAAQAIKHSMQNGKLLTA
jgi:hypothetical protein